MLNKLTNIIVNRFLLIIYYVGILYIKLKTTMKNISLILLLCLIFLCCIRDKIDPRPPSPTYNYWHPDWKGKTAFDTMKAIIPNGIGVITYGDTLTDSIKWSNKIPTYTQEDSLRDHIKRIEYINTIEPFTPYEEIK